MVAYRDAEIDIPTVEWPLVQSRVSEYWAAREAPHISIMAMTRGGKTYLVRHGLLPLCRNDRVLIIDVKGNDPSLRGLGNPVTKLPSRLGGLKGLLRKPEPEEFWYRLKTHRGPQNRDAARRQVTEAFERVMREGDWVVIIDELRAITDPQSPGLHLKPYYEEFILRGGSNGIATVSCSQEPRWCPGSFYTQPNFLFISRVEDFASQKRLSEVASTKSLQPHVASIPLKTWIYMDNMDDNGQRFWAKTKVVKRAAS